MMNILTGWHVAEKFKAKFITVTFEQSLTAGQADTIPLTDAVDGTALKQMLETDNFILFDVFSYANPGFVQIEVLPDNDSTKKFRIEATKNPSRVPLMPPKMAEVDLVLDYTNEDQPNDLYISFSAMRINQEKLPEFTLLSELMPESIERIDTELLNIRMILDNLLTLELAANPDVTIPWDVPQPREKLEEYKEFCKRRGP